MGVAANEKPMRVALSLGVLQLVNRLNRDGKRIPVRRPCVTRIPNTAQYQCLKS